MTTQTFPSPIRAFLDEDRHAILATTRRTGGPQLSPVWYVVDGDKIYVSAVVTTAKIRNLRRNPGLTLCVDGGREDTRYVVVYGTAALVEPGEEGQAAMRRRIIRKYHASDEAAEAYYASASKNPAALIVITPEKVISGNFP